MSEKEIKKQKISIVPNCFENIEHEGQTVQVERYIPIAKKMILFRNYLQSYFRGGDIADFNDDVSRYIDAQYSLILGIVDLCTSISIEDIDIDDLISSGWWTQIRLAIKNYDEVRSDIFGLVKIATEREAMDKSMSSTFDNLAFGILNFINKLDFSSDTIKQLVDTLQGESEKFKEDFMPSKKDKVQEEEISKK